MRSERRVAVTGIGIVSALGTGYKAHAEGLKEGRLGIGPITRFDPERLMVKIAGEARQFEGEDYFTRNEIALLDRISQMALIAARTWRGLPSSLPQVTGARAAAVLGHVHAAPLGR